MALPASSHRMSDLKSSHSNNFNEMKFLQNQVCELSRLCVNKIKRENVWSTINAPPDWPADISWKNPTTTPKDNKECLKRKLKYLRVKTEHLITEHQKLIFRLYDKNKTSDLAAFMKKLKFLSKCKDFLEYLNPISSTEEKNLSQEICCVLDSISDRLKRGTAVDSHEGPHSQEILLCNSQCSASAGDTESSNSGRDLGPAEQNHPHFSTDTTQIPNISHTEHNPAPELFLFIKSNAVLVNHDQKRSINISTDQQPPKDAKRKRPSSSENNSRNCKISKQEQPIGVVPSVTCFVIQPIVECHSSLPTDHTNIIQPSRIFNNVNNVNSQPPKNILLQSKTNFEKQPFEQNVSHSSTPINNKPPKDISSLPKTQTQPFEQNISHSSTSITSQLSSVCVHQSSVDSDHSLSPTLRSEPSPDTHSRSSPARPLGPTSADGSPPAGSSSQRRRTMSTDGGFYSTETNSSVKSPSQQTDILDLWINPERLSDPDVTFDLNEIEMYTRCNLLPERD